MKKTLSTKERLIHKIKKSRTQSQDRKAVMEYALELVEKLPEDIAPAWITEDALMKNYQSWESYSRFGQSLTSRAEIIFRIKGLAQYQDFLMARIKGSHKLDWREIQGAYLRRAAKYILSNL